MVVIDRVKEDFYQRISSDHVLVLVYPDVDSLCACKILQTLFKADNIQYTVVCVPGVAQLKTAFTTHHDKVRSVVLINCGGGAKLIELLQPEEHICIFVVDSVRPLELDNVYNQGQVHIVLREGEVLEIPDFDDIYDSDQGEEDEEEGEEFFSDEEVEGSVTGGKRRRREGESSYEARRRRHLWRRKREEILYKYGEFNYHGTAASLVLYELAWKLTRDNNELLWLAITGLTEQLLHEKTDREMYVTEMHRMQPHVLRLNRSEEETVSAVNTMKINFVEELRLDLYRHWTIYESLCNSCYTACKFKVWAMKGHKNLLEFLADMGLPLVQCKQKFSAMDIQFRENFRSWIDRSAAKFGLDNMTYGSFNAQIGYKIKLSAADMLLSTTALIENPERSTEEAFLQALDALSWSNVTKILAGMETAKLQQVAIKAQVRNFIDTHQVVCTGPFVYAYVEEGTPNMKYFSRPLTLCKLARFLREAWTSSNKRACDYPFILSAPVDLEKGNLALFPLSSLLTRTHTHTPLMVQ
jgi:cell division control protein 45